MAGSDDRARASSGEPGPLMDRLRDIRDGVESLIRRLPLPDDRQRDVFRQYLEAFGAVFARSSPESVLEIGSGFSTYLLAKIAAKTGVRITTVDLNLGRNFRELLQQCREDELSDKVRFVNGITLRHSEFLDYYRSGSISRFGDLDMGDILSNVDDYFVLAGDDRKHRELSSHYQLDGSLQGLKKHLFRDGRFHFDAAVLDVFGFEEESAFIREHEHLYPAFESEVLRQSHYDVIFFDSGEFSSNIEFFKLKDRIQRGGYAIFHDITFPKSIKDFLPCAYIHANPSQWAIRYLDNKTTPQGIMVAQRL